MFFKKGIIILLQYFRKRSFFLIIFFISCGLPSPSELFIERPTLSARVSDDLTITLTISGNYDPDKFIEFEGFNIYIGDNNVEGDIEKRVLYISELDFLPSIKQSPESFLNIEVVLDQFFSYRYTSKANDTDYSEANISDDRNKLLTKEFEPFETYYFRIKAISRLQESVSSITSIVKIPLVIRLEDLDVSSGVRLSSLTIPISSAIPVNLSETFGNIELNNNTINFIDNNINSRKISYIALGSSPDLYSSRGLLLNSRGEFIYQGYSHVLSYPLVEGWSYGFRITDNNLQPISDFSGRDLRMWVDSFNQPRVSLTLAYYENIVTDIDNKEIF